MYTIDIVPKFLSLLVRIDLSIVEFHQKYALVGLIEGVATDENEGVIIGNFDSGDCDRVGCNEGTFDGEIEEAVRAVKYWLLKSIKYSTDQEIGVIVASQLNELSTQRFFK